MSTALVAYFAPAIASAQSGAAPAKAPESDGQTTITTKSDHAFKKLDPTLQKAYKKHNDAKVPVFVSVVGSPASVEAQMDDAYSTSSKGAALVVGKVDSAQLVKLASAKKVLSV